MVSQTRSIKLLNLGVLLLLCSGCVSASVSEELSFKSRHLDLSDWDRPDLPEDLPDMPDLPDLPEDLPEMPELPEDMPEIPDLPEDMPEMPELPEDMPEIPELPEDMPEIPEDMPEVPEDFPELSDQWEDMMNEDEEEEDFPSHDEDDEDYHHHHPRIGRMVVGAIIIFFALFGVGSCINLMFCKKRRQPQSYQYFPHQEMSYSPPYRRP